MPMVSSPSKDGAAHIATLVARTRPLLFGLAGLAAVATLGAANASAGSSDPETWAMDTIAQIKGGQSSEAVGARRPRRASAVERISSPIVDDDEGRRPRQRTAKRSHRGTRVASIGRQFSAPSSGPSVTSERARQKPKAATRHVNPSTVVASLGREFAAPLPSMAPSLSGGSIRWVASSGCLTSPLRNVLGQIATLFGAVTVNSTCRSRRHNARVGGARKSHHLTGNAADFRVRGNVRSVISYLRGNRTVGGLKHYGGGLFHIDTGPRRSW